MQIDPNKLIVLTFVGMPGSGKDSGADYFIDNSKTPEHMLEQLETILKRIEF